MGNTCCSLCCPGCQKRVSKDSRLVRGIFPDDEDGELVRGKMKDLVDYGRTVPDKLEEIVFKIRRKALSYLKSGRPGYVILALEAVNILAEKCHQHISLMSTAVLSFVEVLLEEEAHPSIRIAATRTYVKFSQLVPPAEQHHFRWETFVDFFAMMCWDKSRDAKRINTAGLLGLSSIICSANVVDTHMPNHLGTVVPTVIDHIRSADPGTLAVTRTGPRRVAGAGISDSGDYGVGGGAVELEEVRIDSGDDKARLAVLCLQDLIGNANTETFHMIMLELFRLFHAEAWWVEDPDFCATVLGLVVDANPGANVYKCINALVEHLEDKQTPERIAVMRAVGVVISYIPEDHRSSRLMEVLSALRFQLLQSVRDFESPRCASHEAEKQYQAQITATVGVLARGLEAKHNKKEAMLLLLNAPHGASPYMRSTVLRAVYEVAVTAVEPPASAELIDRLMSESLDRDPYIRLLTLRVVEELFSRPAGASVLVFGAGSQAQARRQAFYRQFGDLIRGALLRGLLLPSNDAATYAACEAVLEAFLDTFRSAELVQAIPMMAHLQDVASDVEQASRHLSVEQRAMLHTVVAAYFHFVARLFKNPTLEDYVETVVRRRLRSQQLSPALTLEVGTGLVVGGAGPAAFGIPPRSSRGRISPMGSSAVVHARSGGDDSEDGIGSVVGSSTGGGGGSTGGGVNEVDLLFDSKKVAMILAKMEGLKQSFPNAGDLLERPYEPYLNALGAAGRSDERSDWADDNIAIPLRVQRQVEEEDVPSAGTFVNLFAEAAAPPVGPTTDFRAVAAGLAAHDAAKGVVYGRVLDALHDARFGEGGMVTSPVLTPAVSNFMFSDEPYHNDDPDVLKYPLLASTGMFLQRAELAITPVSAHNQNFLYL